MPRVSSGTAADTALLSGRFNRPHFDRFPEDTKTLRQSGNRQMTLILYLNAVPIYLAVALGRPAWIRLPFEAEWRWMA